MMEDVRKCVFGVAFLLFDIPSCLLHDVCKRMMALMYLLSSLALADQSDS